MSDFPLGGATPKSSIVDASGSSGVVVAASSTANTKGSWVQLIASTSHDACGILLSIFNSASSISQSDFLYDIGIGGSGSEVVILSNVLFSGSFSTNFTSIDSIYTPLNIPAGSRIAARAQLSAGGSGSTGDIAITLIAPQLSSQPGFGKCTTYGADTATTGGINIDPGATANTKGTWVEFSATTTDDIKWLIVRSGGHRNTARTTCSWLIDVGIGAAASEVVVVPDLLFIASGSLDGVLPGGASLPVNIPKGSRLAVRSQCSITDATDRLLDIELIGVG